MSKNQKNQNKDIRAPIGGEETVNKMTQSERVRMAQGKQMRLDASFYNRLPEYEGHTLFWESTHNGDVEKWLHLGAELVPRRSKSLKEYKGFTDQSISEWECVPVDKDDGGNVIYNYLLSLESDDYHALRIAPKEQHNKEMVDALGRGKTEEQVMPHVKGLQTYAPNLPTGGKGLEQFHQTGETHDV